jgi:hypothetical protein
MRNQKLIFGLILFLLVMLPSAQAQDITEIAYGDTLDGEIIDSDDPVFYIFSGDEGDVVTVSVESDTVDVYVQLGDSDGNVLVENDDISNNDLNAAIEYELPVDGDYLLLVGAYDSGSYEISLGTDSVPAQSGAQTNEGGLVSLGIGDSITGDAISIEEPVVYTFSGNAGESVAISLSSDAVDTYLVLADLDGNLIAENDDISDDNYNSFVEAVLPSNADYLIGVYAYDSGPFELALDSGGGDAPTTPVTSTGGSDAQTATGSIDSENYFVEFPLSDVGEGDTITIDAMATDGDLDVYLELWYGEDVVAENDDRDQSTTDSALEYPNAEAGDYFVTVTRYGFEEGKTEGDFELAVKISSGSTGLVNTSPTSPTNINPVAAGYPTANPTSAIADWTILVYMGGDNNLEDGLENDLDEFEIAGGSTDSVRIVALFDRSDDYSDANGDWTDTRVFEVGNDSSDDAQLTYPPTIDTTDLFNLGELDTSYGNNLADFLVWGIQNYPAQRYAISLNDHGGAWQGIVTDDTTGPGILTLPELQSAFASALQTTGLSKFDLLINDACLMSSVEYYAAMAPYFDYSISSPEITLNPSFDMTLLTQTLNRDPDIDIGDLGRIVVDKYLQDMQDLSPDTAPVLGASVTDLRQMDGVIGALDNFTEVVNSNPDAYGSLLGLVRSNTYAYSFFLPEEEYGPATNIDLGSFMAGVAQETRDTGLQNAALGVLDALNGARIYGSAGPQLEPATSFYNIYFPARSSDFIPEYLQITPLTNWANMLRDYYGSVGVNPRSFRGIAGAPEASAPAAPSLVPQVNITNVFPTQTSVALPTKVSMEVIGRNIAQGIFTVDQIQPDGTSVRLDSARILTTVIENGVADQINLWNPGIDDSTFTWEVTLYTVADGTTSANELISINDNVTSLAGVYTYPNGEVVEVTVLFDDDGNTSSVVSRAPGSVALANITLEAGGIFQTYRSVVTPDGQLVSEPGTQYTWPENGVSWFESPAPDGQYNLGFLVEAFGGATGFDSVEVTVNNSGVEADRQGYIDLDWGFIFQRPADWSNVVYFPDDQYLTTNSSTGTQNIYVYAVDDETDLETIAQLALEPYSVTINDDFTATSVGDQDALTFTFSYETTEGTEGFAKAMVVYLDDVALGFVFSSEGADEAETERVFDLMQETLTFFDATAVNEQDQGQWEIDVYTDNDRYPVRKDWLPGANDGLWWYYHPGDDQTSTTFAAITVLTDVSDSAAQTLEEILDQEIEDKPNYELVNTETYYGENQTWESASFTHDGPNGEPITGRLYATVTEDGIPYLLWFEAPSEEFDQLLSDVFFVMLDGFKITAPSEEE